MHTRGPIKYIVHDAVNGNDYIQLLAGSWDIAHNRHSARNWEEEKGNARLLAAAWNSYDRHFGPRAVQAAEEDVLGQALKACRLALKLVELIPVEYPDRSVAWEQATNAMTTKLAAVLAKVETKEG